MRTCTSCQKPYPASVEYFSPQRRGLFGLTATCKTCRTRKSKNYHSQNPESRIEAGLKRKFGLTLEEWNKMFDAQQGCCAICGEHQSVLPRRLAVYHNHQTGKIRALLCQHCNQGLGHFRDNVARLNNATRYLETHTA